MTLWFFFSYLVCQSVSVTGAVCLALPPALTPWISSGAASLSGDKNPEYLPSRCRKSRWDYNIIQGDNPVYSDVKKWGELQQPCGCVDRVGGDSEVGGGGCRVSLGDEVASTVLDWAVLTHKKRLRDAANYRLNFLDIFVLFFLLLYGCTHLKCCPQRKARLLGNRLNCPAFATVIATAEPPWGWWWAGPRWLRPTTHLWKRAVFKLGKWLQNTCACSFVLNILAVTYSKALGSILLMSSCFDKFTVMSDHTYSIVCFAHVHI